MKTTYTKLLNQAAPLPYKAMNSGSGSWVWAKGIIADCAGNESSAEAMLLAHSTNVLPEALATLKGVQAALRQLNHNDLQSQIRRIQRQLKATIAAIEKVDL